MTEYREGFNCQVFGDGNNLILFMKEGRMETAMTIKNPLICTYTTTMDNPMESVQLLGGEDHIVDLGPPMVDIELGMKCRGEDLSREFSDTGDLMPTIDVFKNLSVGDLFKAINRKLNARRKE